MTKSLKTKIGILASCFCAMSFIAFSPIVYAVSESFPEYTLSMVQMMVTLPSLMFILFSPLSGVLMRYVPKKTLAICSVAMYFVSGMFSFTFHNSLILILVGSAIMGCGTGVLMPVINALICDNFEGNDRGAVMGLNSTFVAIGGLTFTFISGQLASIDWKYSFLVFLLIIPILIIMAVFLPKSEKTEKGIEKVKKEKVKLHFNSYLIVLFVVGFVYFCLQNAYNTNASVYVDELNAGGTALSGIVTMMNPLGGIIGGILFGFLLSKSKDQIESVALLLAGAGFVFAGIVNSIPSVMIAGILIGAAYALFNAGGTYLLAKNLNSDENEILVSIYMAIVNLGAAVSPYIVNSLSGVFGEGTTVKYLFAGIFILVLTVISVIAGLSKAKNQ